MKLSRRITMKAVKGLMDKSYPLVWIDYRDTLSGSLPILQRCIDEKCGDALALLVDDWYYDSFSTAVREIFHELKDACIAAGHKSKNVHRFFKKHNDCIEGLIVERDSSTPLRDLLRNTGPIPVRVSMYSNYDCINSHWLESSGGYDYHDSYFGAMVDALMLNPCKVRQAFKAHGIKTFGSFPNKRSRNGKELVSYGDFIQETENSTCGANLLTFIGTIDPVALYEANFDLKQITIPKGNSCGLFSTMQGGGSVLEMKLLHDVTLSLQRKTGCYDYYGLSIDHYEDKYSIGDTYGVTRRFFGENLKIAA